MRLISLNIIFFICPFIYFAQKVNNVDVSQVGQKIVVSYNLETEQPCTINLLISTNGGNAWQGPLKQVQGQVGPNITSGKNSITFFVLNEFDELRGDNIRFKVEVQEESVFQNVDENAEFPGPGNSLAAMGQYLRVNMKFPYSASQKGISGKCFLKFVVTETGEISNVEVLKGVPGCPDCDEEAIRVVKSMPRWKPAKIKGRPVKCYFNLPFSFKSS